MDRFKTEDVDGYQLENECEMNLSCNGFANSLTALSESELWDGKLDGWNTCAGRIAEGCAWGK